MDGPPASEGASTEADSAPASSAPAVVEASEATAPAANSQDSEPADTAEQETFVVDNPQQLTDSTQTDVAEQNTEEAKPEVVHEIESEMVATIQRMQGLL